MRLWENKKGKSIGSDSPYQLVIKIEYHRNFDDSKTLICWRYQKLLTAGIMRGSEARPKRRRLHASVGRKSALWCKVWPKQLQ